MCRSCMLQLYTVNHSRHICALLQEIWMCTNELPSVSPSQTETERHLCLLTSWALSPSTCEVCRAASAISMARMTVRAMVRGTNANNSGSGIPGCYVQRPEGHVHCKRLSLRFGPKFEVTEEQESVRYEVGWPFQ